MTEVSKEPIIGGENTSTIKGETTSSTKLHRENVDENFDMALVLNKIANNVDEMRRAERENSNLCINLDNNNVSGAAFGTQGDVIHYNYYLKEEGTNRTQLNPTESTPDQLEDLPELEDCRELKTVESILLKKRVVVIEQHPGNHLFISNFLRKIRFNLQTDFNMRDAQGPIDTTLYCRQWNYESPTITTLMPGLDVNSILPLLHHDEYNRIVLNLEKNNNYLLIFTQLNVARLSQKESPPVKSEIYVVCPEVIGSINHEERDQPSQNELDALFHSDVKIRPFIIFVLGFFPGLDLEQFNGVVQYWLEINPQLMNCVDTDEAVSSKSDEDNSDPKKVRQKTWSWQIDGDRIVRESHGVFVQDSSWGKGYYFKGPRYTQTLQKLLLTQYPNYCQQHFQELMPLYLQSPDRWLRFRDHYKNTFLNYFNLKFLMLDEQWLSQCYQTQRINANRLGLLRFVDLLRHLNDDEKGTLLVKNFYLSLAETLLIEQDIWREKVERSGYHYDTRQLAEFQQEIVDYVQTIKDGCGFSEGYITPLFERFLSNSALPFSSPFFKAENDEFEAVLCPLSWYIKYQIELSYRSHSDYFALVKKLLTLRDEPCSSESSLGLRSAVFLCYFVAVKTVEREADERANNAKNKPEQKELLPPMIRNLIVHTYNSGTFVELVLSQLRIVRDICTDEVYSRWIEHQLHLIENIVLIALTSQEWDEEVYGSGLKTLCNQLIQGLPKRDVRILKVLSRERLMAFQDQYHLLLNQSKYEQQLALKLRLQVVKKLRKFLKE